MLDGPGQVLLMPPTERDLASRRPTVLRIGWCATTTSEARVSRPSTSFRRSGADVPYPALAEGFNFRGRRVPFLNRSYGIFRSAEAQRGPAALSVNSSYKQDRYRDEQTPDGVLYRYQGNDPDNHFNRWLRSAHLLDVPLVYFVGTRPNWYPADLPDVRRAGLPG